MIRCRDYANKQAENDRQSWWDRTRTCAWDRAQRVAPNLVDLKENALPMHTNGKSFKWLDTISQIKSTLHKARAEEGFGVDSNCKLHWDNHKCIHDEELRHGVCWLKGGVVFQSELNFARRRSSKTAHHEASRENPSTYWKAHTAQIYDRQVPEKASRALNTRRISM